MKTRQRLAYLASSLVGLALLGWFVYTLSKAGPAVQSAILALIGTVLASSLMHFSAKKREIDARHFEKKSEGYQKFIDLMIEMIQSTKSGNPTSQDELIRKMFDFKRTLFVWADADVIRAWNKFEELDWEGKNKGDLALAFRVWDELLRALRRDLGKQDGLLPKGDLVGLILLPGEKEKAREACQGRGENK